MLTLTEFFLEIENRMKMIEMDWTKEARQQEMDNREKHTLTFVVKIHETFNATTFSEKQLFTELM